MPAVSEAEFRSACSQFPTGVAVVARQTRDGRPYGLTVSSFTSVSLQPPLILVCIDKRGGFVADLEPGAHFSVNVLREDQREIAVRFSRLPERDRFSDVEWHSGEFGAPLLDSAVAIFECAVTEMFPGGDHLIVVGEVRSIVRSQGRPLLWALSNYHLFPAKIEA